MRVVRKGASKLLFQLRGRAITSRATFSLPGDSRLKARRDFLRVREYGRKVHSRHFLVVYAPSERAARIGIAVTKKSEPSAVKRNLIKRRVREVFRLHRCRLKGNFDIVVVARRGASKAPFSAVSKEIVDAFELAGLLR